MITSPNVQFSYFILHYKYSKYEIIYVFNFSERFWTFALSTAPPLDSGTMRRKVAILLCLASLISLFPSEGYIVDGVNGNDSNDGETVTSPFQTIGRCVEALANPGDECLIRAGHYHEVVTVSGLQGEENYQSIEVVSYVS